jgi:hypothetical protein
VELPGSVVFVTPMEPGLAKKAVNFSAFLDADRPDYHVVHHKNTSAL